MKSGRSPIVVSRRDGLVFERSASAHTPGLFRVDKRIECRGVVERSIVTGHFWIFATVAEETGLTEAFCAHRWLPLPHCRAFMIPPRSVLRLRLSEVRLRACGLVGKLPLPNDLASVPRFSALEPLAPPVPHDLAGITAYLHAATLVDPDEGVGEIAREARRGLYQVLDSVRPVRAVAGKLGVAPETISRAFLCAYGVSPKAYVHGARVSDAVLRLMTGSGMLGAAFDAGFGHASRFYDIFKRWTGNTPGEYVAEVDQKSRRR
jgi:AraC-like DNA-binding protein